MKILMVFQRETDPPPAGPFSDICFKYVFILNLFHSFMQDQESGLENL